MHSVKHGIEVSLGFTSVKKKKQAVSGATELRCKPSEAIRTLRFICGRSISKDEEHLTLRSAGQRDVSLG